MKTVVITGSTRGLGFEMAKHFLTLGWNVSISGRSWGNIDKAILQLDSHRDHVLGTVCDVTKVEDVIDLWNVSKQRWGQIDIWINNAGVSQPYKPLWELNPSETQTVIQTNLFGVMYGSQIAMRGMMEQGFGQIFNMEGFGSQDMQRKGLNLYGTTKRALTYFTTALAKEAAETPVKIGLLSPGMMVTDFINNLYVSEQNRLRTEKIFNILGDKPDTVAEFLVECIVSNTNNHAHYMWLTKRKATYRFLKSMFIKRNLFSEQPE